MQAPNRVANVHFIAQGKGKTTTFRNGGADRGFKEVHEADVAGVAGVVVVDMWVRGDEQTMFRGFWGC